MPSRVKTGLEVLVAQNFAPLKGKTVGLVTNPTGILPDLSSTIEVLARAPGVRLRALFGPEHGVRGNAEAGASVASSKDPQTGLPVYSLYGKTKIPTRAMLSGLDAIVFDIQDIGARSYTYLSTLGAVMEGAARANVPIIVLDRPNPLGGLRVEGLPTQPGFTSFVSAFPVPYLHGMTLGELARLINGKGLLPGNLQCKLTVVPCENLNRNMATWDAMGGLPWVPPSPHVPNPDSPHFYALTGIVGELPTVSIGIGWPQPFALAGAPDISPVALLRALEKQADFLPGLTYRPTYWTPFYGTYKGKTCGGVQIYLTDAARAPLTRFNFALLEALRSVRPNRPFFPPGEETRMFDLGCGTSAPRKAFQSGASARQMWEKWNPPPSAFLVDRKPYLLYE